MQFTKKKLQSLWNNLLHGKKVTWKIKNVLNGIASALMKDIFKLQNPACNLRSSI